MSYRFNISLPQKILTRVEKYPQKRRTKRQFLSVFVGFIGFACKKHRVLMVFVGFRRFLLFETDENRRFVRLNTDENRSKRQKNVGL